jgi:hypothetical protein
LSRPAKIIILATPVSATNAVLSCRLISLLYSTMVANVTMFHMLTIEMPESYYHVLTQNDHGKGWIRENGHPKVTVHPTAEKLAAIDDSLQFIIDMSLPV